MKIFPISFTLLHYRKHSSPLLNLMIFIELKRTYYSVYVVPWLYLLFVWRYLIISTKSWPDFLLLFIFFFVSVMVGTVSMVILDLFSCGRVSGTYPGLMAGGHRPGVPLAEPGCSGYADTCQQRFASGSGYLDSSLQRGGSGYPDNSLQRLTTALQGLNPAEVERRRRLMAHTHRYRYPIRFYCNTVTAKC